MPDVVSNPVATRRRVAIVRAGYRRCHGVGQLSGVQGQIPRVGFRWHPRSSSRVLVGWRRWRNWSVWRWAKICLVPQVLKMGFAVVSALGPKARGSVANAWSDLSLTRPRWRHASTPQPSIVCCRLIGEYRACSNSGRYVAMALLTQMSPTKIDDQVVFRLVGDRSVGGGVSARFAGRDAIWTTCVG